LAKGIIDYQKHYLNDNGVDVVRKLDGDACEGRPFECHLAEWAIKKDLCFFAACWDEADDDKVTGEEGNKLECHWPAGMYCAKKQCAGELLSFLSEDSLTWKQ